MEPSIAAVLGKGIKSQKYLNNCQFLPQFCNLLTNTEPAEDFIEHGFGDFVAGNVAQGRDRNP